jgi:hypothetical protein
MDDLEAVVFDFIRDGGNPWSILAVEKAFNVTH